MKRQALYRITWDGDGMGQRPPAVIPIRSAGPWEPGVDAELVYEGPAGRTTVTVEAVVIEPAAKEDA